jgi:hypothetical protein
MVCIVLVAAFCTPTIANEIGSRSVIELLS